MNATPGKIGRLALRREGENWNAYYAMPDTMDRAVYLGSIRMSAVETRPERKEMFMALMRELICDIIEESTGIRPVFREPEGAPEHERSGRA